MGDRIRLSECRLSAGSIIGAEAAASRYHMPKIGFATGYDPDQSVPEMAEWMQHAEERGFDVGFFSETNNLMRDGVSAMSAFARATEKMHLGFTQVVRLRSPVTMGQTVATLDELADERLFLAPGACTSAQARTHSLEDVDPPGTLTEWVDVMRAVLAGEDVTYDGEHLEFDGIGLGWTPVREDVPFYVAATSRTGLKLAAELSDGVLLNTVSSPEYSANAIEFLRDQVESVGKDWDEFTVAQLINTSIEERERDAVDAVRWEVASKFRPPFYQFGMRKRVGEPVIDESVLPDLEEAYERDGDVGVERALPESWVHGLTACGTPDQARNRVDEYRKAGVEIPILRPAATHQTELLFDTFGSA